MTKDSEIIKGGLTLNGVFFDVELADRTDEQGRGLSGRSGLSKNQAMLFYYPKPGLRSFWMKDMQFPIDIVWLNENRQIIAINRDIRPESYPNSYTTSEPSKFVIEVAASTSSNLGLQVGDQVTFSDDLSFKLK